MINEKHGEFMLETNKWYEDLGCVTFENAMDASVETMYLFMKIDELITWLEKNSNRLSGDRIDNLIKFGQRLINLGDSSSEVDGSV